MALLSRQRKRRARPLLPRGRRARGPSGGADHLGLPLDRSGDHRLRSRRVPGPAPAVEYATNSYPARHVSAGAGHGSGSLRRAGAGLEGRREPGLARARQHVHLPSSGVVPPSRRGNDVDLSHLRWTVDTPEDFDLVQHVYEHFGHDRFTCARCWDSWSGGPSGRKSTAACSKSKSTEFTADPTATRLTRSQRRRRASVVIGVVTATVAVGSGLNDGEPSLLAPDRTRSP